MKVKLIINKSETKDMTHFIYRFKNEAYKESIEDYINNLTPIAEINEVDNEETTIEFIDESANGLYEPKLKILETSDIISIFQEEKTKKNIYTYRIISKTKLGKISNISKPVFAQVSEKNNLVSFNVYYKNDTNDIEENWKKVCEKNILEEFKINKNIELASENLNSLNRYDIYVDDSLIRVNNSRILKILNIFNISNEERLYRNSKSYKIENVCGNLTSGFSDIFTNNKRTKVMVDKIEVYKKEVTDIENKEEPIAIGSSKLLLSKLVRLGGRYLKENGLVIPNDTRNDFLNIKDSCIFTKRYNYTVYLFDEGGNISPPIVKVF